MSIITTSLLEHIFSKNSRRGQEILPELVKRLILSNATAVSSIRIPDKDDIWAPGFDGVIDINENIAHVNKGISVWEFGTNTDSLAKINSDYEKRTSNPAGIQKKSTSFYLVIPKIWAYKDETLTEWEENHKEEWRYLHVIDAVELCQWINETPNVSCWLIEKYSDVNDLDYGSVEKFWEDFSKKSNPVLCEDLFLNDRNELVASFYEKVQGNLTRIKSETFIEAYGFCLAAFMSNENLKNTVIVVNNVLSFKELDKIVRNKIFLFAFRCDKDILSQNNNKAVLCFNKEDVSIQEDIVLKKLNKKNFEAALIIMGIKEREAVRLCKITNRNVLSLIRNIQGCSNISKPTWANEIDYGFLVPLLFLRNFNTTKECQKYIIELLSGKNYIDFENAASSILKKEDSPIKQVENFYSLINYEETWNILQLKTSDSYYRNLVDIILEFVRLENEEKYNIELLSQLDNGTFSNLLHNFIYFSQSGASERDIVSYDVKGIINELNEHKKYSLLFDSLSILSKAAPEIVMDYLYNEIHNQDGVVLSLFDEKCYTGDYCKILWALDGLARQEATKIRACFALKDLYLKNYTYRISNSPKDSLMNVLCLLNTKGALLLEEKKDIVLKFLETEPRKLFDLIISLLKMNSFSYSYGVEDKEIESIETITLDIYFTTINIIISRLKEIVFQCKSAKLLTALLQQYRVIFPELLKRFAEESYSGFNEEELQETYFYLVNEIYRIQKYLKGSPDKLEEYIPFLSAVGNKIKSKDLFFRYLPFFKNYWDCPIVEEVPFEDGRRADRPFEYRLKLYQLLKNQHGAKVYIRLIQALSDESVWGRIIYAADKEIDIVKFSQKCIEFNKIVLLSGFIEGLSIQQFRQIMTTFSLDIQIKVYGLMRRTDIIDLLDCEEKKRAFWKNQMMRDYSSEVFESLLEYNPTGLLNYYVLNKVNQDNLKNVLTILEKIFANFDQLSKKIDAYYIDNLFNQIDKLIYNEKIAELEIGYYRYKVFNGYKNGMKKYYFYNPIKLVEIINGDQFGEFYFDITREYNLPDEAYNDYRKFLFFFETILNEVTDKDLASSICGQILGKSILGSDKIFPHEFVRAMIETHSNDKMLSGFFIGKINSIGVRTVTDGEKELTIAQHYEDNAKKIEIEYPITATLLRKIAKDYRHTAKEDRIYSEIGIDN